MSATRFRDPNAPVEPVLYVAFELSWGSWKLAFTTGSGQAPRIRTIAARNTPGVLREIADAKVVSCYEAGRDGFWLHRFLAHSAIENVVVDSASIEVNRRKRRAKSDRLDSIKLLSMLIRWRNGETMGWRTAFRCWQATG
jgi:transposase